MGLEYSVPDNNPYASEHEECKHTGVNMTKEVEAAIKLRCKQQFRQEAVRSYALRSAEIQLAIAIFLSLLVILAIVALAIGYYVYRKKEAADYGHRPYTYGSVYSYPPDQIYAKNEKLGVVPSGIGAPSGVGASSGKGASGKGASSGKDDPDGIETGSLYHSMTSMTSMVPPEERKKKKRCTFL